MAGITGIKRIGSKLKANRIALYISLIMVVFASVLASQAFSRSWAAMKMQKQQAIEVQFAPGQYLVVEPTDVYTEPIVAVPSGMTSLALPNRIDDGVNGYCLVHVVDIVVRVTDESSVGDTGTVELLATGSWPGQTGQAQICQSRSFKFDVEVVQ